MHQGESGSSFPPSERIDRGPIAEFELTRRRQPAFVDHAFAGLEVSLGSDGDSSPIEIVSGLDWPQVRARYVAVQRSVLAEDPRRGWAPVGGVHPAGLLVGPRCAGSFSFAEDVGREDGLLVRAYETFLSLTACGEVSATVRVAVADLLTAAEASARPREPVFVD